MVREFRVTSASSGLKLFYHVLLKLLTSRFVLRRLM